MNWLLDTDVICQPAKRHGDGRVIAWLEEEQDRCYTSAVVIAQLAHWVGASVQDHPDFAWYPTERAQENPELDYSLVTQLVLQAR